MIKVQLKLKNMLLVNLKRNVEPVDYRWRCLERALDGVAVGDLCVGVAGIGW